MPPLMEVGVKYNPKCKHMAKYNTLSQSIGLSFNRQIIQFEFSPTLSCVSLTRSTTLSEWKIFRFDQMEVNSFQILLVDVTFYL